MSYTTITASTRDVELKDRIVAAALKEAIANPTYAATHFASDLLAYPDAAFTAFLWPIAVDNEAAYAYAIGTSNPSPGGDPGVISDAALQAGVQAHWPNL